MVVKRNIFYELCIPKQDFLKQLDLSEGTSSALSILNKEANTQLQSLSRIWFVNPLKNTATYLNNQAKVPVTISERSSETSESSCGKYKVHQ